VQLFAIGSALREVCGDQAALGLRFVEEARTAPRYRLFSIDDRFAALVEDPERGVSVAGEIVELDDSRFEELLRSEPPGLVQELAELEDGRRLSTAFADLDRTTGDVREITEFGSFGAYLRSKSKSS
jgi:hypothetical protein